MLKVMMQSYLGQINQRLNLIKTAGKLVFSMITTILSKPEGSRLQKHEKRQDQRPKKVVIPHIDTTAKVAVDGGLVSEVTVDHGRHARVPLPARSLVPDDVGGTVIRTLLEAKVGQKNAGVIEVVVIVGVEVRAGAGQIPVREIGTEVEDGRYRDRKDIVRYQGRHQDLLGRIRESIFLVLGHEQKQFPALDLDPYLIRGRDPGRGRDRMERVEVEVTVVNGVFRINHHLEGAIVASLTVDLDHGRLLSKRVV